MCIIPLLPNQKSANIVHIRMIVYSVDQSRSHWQPGAYLMIHLCKMGDGLVPLYSLKPTTQFIPEGETQVIL